MNVKIYLIATMLSAIVLALIFVPMSGSQITFQYDPWADINDNGKIDGTDITYICRLFGTAGDPINKTALLYNVNATLTELLSRIDQLNMTLIELQSKVNTLETLLPPNKIRILPIDFSPDDNNQQYIKTPTN
jgi:hypothetical protein